MRVLGGLEHGESRTDGARDGGNDVIGELAACVARHGAALGDAGGEQRLDAILVAAADARGDLFAGVVRRLTARIAQNIGRVFERLALLIPQLVGRSLELLQLPLAFA